MDDKQMLQNELTAYILASSKTINAVLGQVLGDFHIQSEILSDAYQLEQAVKDKEPDLIFVAKEMAAATELEPLEYFCQLRAHFHGPIIMISGDQDIEYIESYVSAGVTDVFSLAEFSQIENFISNFVSYRNTINDTKQAKVLLVEDSRSIMSLVTLLFEQNNIEVLTVPTGREALTVLHFEQVDLVITDFMLEGDMTGLSLIRNIRRTSQWYSLPIIAITGYQDLERDKELLRNGVSDVIHKPFDVDVFLIKCQNLIMNKRTFETLIEKQTQVRELVNTDAMTGLFNRFYISRQVEQLLKDRPQGNLFALHFDCDDFKSLNDNLGHQTADEVLVEISQLLQSRVSNGDLVARLDGDEFLYVMPSSSFDHALQMADMLRESIAQKFAGGHRLTVSVGVSGQNQTHASFSDIYADTDKAIMSAKDKGKNQVAVGSLISAQFS